MKRKRTILLVNSVLMLLVISSLSGYFLLEPNIPQRPDLSQIKKGAIDLVGAQAVKEESRYENLGAREVFRTLIPKPTPTPTPPPPPPKNPPLNVAMQGWKVTSIDRGEAEFFDATFNKYETWKVGEIKEIKAQNRGNINVRLKETDMKRYTVIMEADDIKDSGDWGQIFELEMK